MIQSGKLQGNTGLRTLGANATKFDALDEIYTKYAMTKGQRVAALGKMLNKIDAALDNLDIDTLAQVAPDKLIDLKLKYQTALKDECDGIEHPTGQDPKLDTIGAEMIDELRDIFKRVRDGNMTTPAFKTVSPAALNVLKGIAILKDCGHSIPESIQDDKEQ